MIKNLLKLKPYRRANRNNPTSAELAFWELVRKKRLRFRFLRQFSIGQYIVDFYCPKLKLAVEIDGEYHCEVEQEKYDLIRGEFLESLKIKVIRFTNNEVLNNIDGVYDKMVEVVQYRITEFEDF